MKCWNWKYWVLCLLVEVLDGCVQLVMQCYNCGIEWFVIDYLCQNNVSIFYKWMGNGCLLLIMVLLLEKVCGLLLIICYLVVVYGKFLVDILVGKVCNVNDLQ